MMNRFLKKKCFQIIPLEFYRHGLEEGTLLLCIYYYVDGTGEYMCGTHVITSSRFFLSMKNKILIM